MVQSLWRRVWKFLKKLKIELPYGPVIPLLSIYLEKNIVQKNTFTPMFIAEQFTRDRTWKQLQLSINRAMDKGDVAHIYNGILLSHKKKQN